MNRDTFLQSLFSMYPNTFTEKNLQTWHKAYCIVFGNKKIDFDKMFELYVTNYQNTNTPPAPAWFKEHLNECIIKPDKCAALRNIENMKNEECIPMPESFKEKMRALIAKATIPQQ